MESIAPHPADSEQGPARSGPTSVYRYYDAVGILLYVGITKQGMGRNLQHNGKAGWWPFVARQEVDHFPTRETAARREKELIGQHRPPFNKQHNPTHAVMRETYLQYARTFSGQMGTAVDFYRALGKKLPLDVVSLEPLRLVLRSRIEHGPLALILQRGAGPDLPVVRGRRRAYGHVEKVEQFGPVAFVHCRLRSFKKVRPPEGGIGAAEVLIAWDTKAQRATIKQILVTEGDLMVDGSAA